MNSVEFRTEFTNRHFERTQKPAIPKLAHNSQDSWFGAENSNCELPCETAVDLAGRGQFTVLMASVTLISRVICMLRAGPLERQLKTRWVVATRGLSKKETKCLRSCCSIQWSRSFNPCLLNWSIGEPKKRQFNGLSKPFLNSQGLLAES